MAFEKDPNAVLDYVLDWTAWLASDTISTSTYQVSGDITKASDTNTTTTTTIFLSGGTPGETYRIRNRITTAGGRTADWTFEVTVRDQ